MSPSNRLQPQPGQQIATTVDVVAPNQVAGTRSAPLLLYAPTNYGDENSQPWPLVLFLHGAHESGDGSAEQIDRVATHGPPMHAASGRELPFVLIAPQIQRPDEIEEVRAAWQPDLLLPLLDKAVAELSVDKSRIYVTGVSMGGYGTWRLAAAAPDRFAAAVPMGSGGNPKAMAAALAKLSIWAFHNAKDDVVPLEQSASMVDAIRRAGGNARLTTYPQAGHNAWTVTYDNPMFYDWLLGESK